MLLCPSHVLSVAETAYELPITIERNAYRPRWKSGPPLRKIFVVIECNDTRVMAETVNEIFVNRLVTDVLERFGRVARSTLISNPDRTTKFIELLYAGQDGGSAAQQLQRFAHRSVYHFVTLHVTYADLRRLPKPPRFLPFVVAAGVRGYGRMARQVQEEENSEESVVASPPPSASSPPPRAPTPPRAPSPPIASPPAASPPPAAPSPPKRIQLRGTSFSLGRVDVETIRAAFADEPDKEVRTEFIRGMRALLAESFQCWDDAVKSLETYSESLEDKRTLDDFKCVVCIDKYRCCMGTNCSHIHLCEECAIKITKTTKTCPWCRKRFETFNKVIF
jgi:hypothetical protein